jgi:hypothetical protein
MFQEDGRRQIKYPLTVQSGGPARAAHPQREVENDLSRLVSAATDSLEEKLHGALRHPADGLGQGRERGIHELCPERVVYGHERQVLRHPEPSGELAKTRETVAADTPALSATSLIRIPHPIEKSMSCNILFVASPVNRPRAV